MSRQFTGMDAGIVTVSALVARGRWRRATKLLRSLLTWRPMMVSRELQLRKLSAEVSLRMGEFRMARRHCRLALRLDPTAAAFHYLYGRTFMDDPFGCPMRAVRHFRKATKLNAQEPLSRASLGRAMIRVSEIRSGLKVMQAAVEKAPTDPEVLQVVSEGLAEAGRSDIAFNILSKARFLDPTSHVVRELWHRARYDLAAQSQPKTTRKPAPRSGTLRLHDGESYRADSGHGPEPHILRFSQFHSDRG